MWRVKLILSSDPHLEYYHYCGGRQNWSYVDCDVGSISSPSNFSDIWSSVQWQRTTICPSQTSDSASPELAAILRLIGAQITPDRFYTYSKSLSFLTITGCISRYATMYRRESVVLELVLLSLRGPKSGLLGNEIVLFAGQSLILSKWE